MLGNQRFALTVFFLLGCVQLSPPLVMSEAQIDGAVSMLAGAIESARLEVAAEAEVAAATQ